MTDTWSILSNELKYYGIILINNNKCKVDLGNGLKTQDIAKTIRQIDYTIRKKKELFVSLWESVYSLLNEGVVEKERGIIDYRMEKLFIFSLKEMALFLLCFDAIEVKKFTNIINDCLNKDIKSFAKYQIYSLSDYKISIDWIYRLISFFSYIKNLLIMALKGKDKVNSICLNKTASGVSGPWSRLDLPMEERCFPFGQELDERKIEKMKQRRYRKGLENYNNDGRTGEGHFWRELRNEPFSWYDRGFEDPYPSRHLLSR